MPRTPRILFLLLASLGGVLAGASSFILSDECPPYFVKRSSLCFHRNAYTEAKNVPELLRLVPLRNGLNPKKIHLGKLLFFDPLLSGDMTLSCAHCHQPSKSWTDGKMKGQGVSGELNRNTPSLWNVGFYKNLFWDGRATTLESQALGPLLSPREMSSSRHIIEARLNANATYKRLFLEVYKKKSIRLEEVVDSISVFEETLVSFNSRYDRYIQGDEQSLTAQEKNGLTLFRSFVTRCWECHTPPLFSNQQFAIIGAPDSGSEKDPGQRPENLGSFKVPGLRNLKITAPYMHSGKLETLADVVHFYNLGAGRGPLGQSSPFTHWHIRPMGLSDSEEAELLSFLESLEDESAMPVLPNEVPSGIAVFREGKSDR